MDSFSLLDDPRTAFALWHLNKVYYKKSKQKEQDIYSSTNHIYIYICIIYATYSTIQTSVTQKKKKEGQDKKNLFLSLRKLTR